MNKIYKVKKNAAGNSVACSEFAKGHAKKAVLGSLLIIGALGMATTASAQVQSSSIEALEEIEKKTQELLAQADAGKITNDEMVKKLLAFGIQGNQISIQDLNTRSDINKDKIQMNDDYIGDLYEANEENVNRLIEHGDKIWANEESIQYLNKEVQNNINNIQNLSKASSANTKRISTAELGIAENKKDALIAKAQADKNKNDIQDLAKAQLAGVETMKELDKNVQANKADADAKFKGVQTDIANNKTTLAQHTKQINENKQAIEAKLGSKADTQKLAELKTNVDKNQADIADNINNIHKLAQQQDQHGSDIRTLAKAGITNKDAIAKNTQSITTLDSKVNTFDGRISALDAKVNGFDGRINALDDKFKNGMAVQAALNGLFQPYGIGKVSVSAAIGGYDSKSAIAIGAGYRVNPQLAFKGGTAINMSGSKKGSYNLGVNYEF